MTHKHNKAQLERALRYRDAVRQVLLRDWDPIGVAEWIEAQDEYDSYVWPVCRLLMASKPREEIARYLHSVETRQMGLGGRNEHLEAVVDELQKIPDQIDRDARPTAP